MNQSISTQFIKDPQPEAKGKISQIDSDNEEVRHGTVPDPTPDNQHPTKSAHLSPSQSLALVNINHLNKTSSENLTKLLNAETID